MPAYHYLAQSQAPIAQYLIDRLAATKPGPDRDSGGSYAYHYGNEEVGHIAGEAQLPSEFRLRAVNVLGTDDGRAKIAQEGKEPIRDIGVTVAPGRVTG